MRYWMLVFFVLTNCAYQQEPPQTLACNESVCVARAESTECCANQADSTCGDAIVLRSDLIKERLHFYVAADAHLALNDARGDAYRCYSDRMAHDPGDPAAFSAMLKRAQAQNVDCVILAGDMLSFPSEAGVEFLCRELRNLKMPWLFIAGNHDWHYEGLPGSDEALRRTWSAKRLSPLYQGDAPLMAVREIKGVLFVTIDNSTYQITPEQLDFFRRQAISGRPIVLILHIPLYFDGLPYEQGQCGNPKWGAAIDPYWQIERRERWPELGATETTRTFCKEVFETPALLGVFAGHIHRRTRNSSTYAPQITAPQNRKGAFLDISILPNTP